MSRVDRAPPKCLRRFRVGYRDLRRFASDNLESARRYDRDGARTEFNGIVNTPNGTVDTPDGIVNTLDPRVARG